MEVRLESIRSEFSTSNPIGMTLHKFSNILDYAPWLKELEVLVHYFSCALLSLLVHLRTMKKVVPPKTFFKNCAPYPVAS